MTYLMEKRFPFKDLGKYYYKVVVSFKIKGSLEETWLISEMGLCGADDINKTPYC